VRSAVLGFVGHWRVHRDFLDALDWRAKGLACLIYTATAYRDVFLRVVAFAIDWIDDSIDLIS